MATGVQSGFRTTGSQPGSAPGGASAKIPFFNGLVKFLSGFTAKQKIIALMSLFLLAATILSILFYQKSTAFVPLYPDKLSAVDAGKISFELDRMSISYTLAEGGSVVMVPPSCRTRVRAHMAQLHLPQRLLKKTEGEGSMMKTASEMEYNRQLALQAELSESIRSLEGVADAYVTIARPERDYFKLDNAVTTASVIVSTNPGVHLAPAQVKGIRKLVASSVSELDEKNVTVVDQSGIVMAAADDGASIELTGKEQEKKISYEQYLQGKVQGILDKAFGPGKAIVVIDTTIDASSSRTEKYVVGDPSSKGSVVTKRKSRDEHYSSARKDGDTGTQMSFKGSIDSASNGQAYNNGEITEIMDVNRIKTETVKPAGEISRVTASVLVDNLSPAQVDKVREIVKGAIGYDDQTRNDAVTVASVPFTSNVVQDLQRQRMQGQGRQGQGAMLTPLHLLALNAVMLTLLVPFAVYAVRRRETSGKRSGLFLAASQAATSCDIADLNTEKHGRGRESENTRVNTSEKLAQFATERPSEVAGLLKSTWLAEKKR